LPRGMFSGLWQKVPKKPLPYWQFGPKGQNVPVVFGKKSTRNFTKRLIVPPFVSERRYGRGQKGGARVDGQWLSGS